jgi:hypothetical protein
MANFAKIDENNYVIAVLVVNNDVISINGIENEEIGIDFLINLTNHLKWKQTSYNGNFRKNYAGISYYYDSIRDAFIPPKPFPSWILNEDTCLWESPIPYPNDGNIYQWNEETGNWEQIN